MLTIRKAQMDALASEVVLDFEERALTHLCQTSPEWSEAMEADPCEEFVRHGLRRARRYGFETEFDVMRYLLAMQALGMRFDESPEHEWAAALLARRMPPGQKLDRLLDAVHYQREARRIRHVD